MAEPPSTGPAAAAPAPGPRPEPAPAPLPPPPRRRRVKPGYVVGALILLIAVAGAILYYLKYVAPFESTDDAFIEGDVTFVSPRIAGQVIRLLVNDNQQVKEGDPLIEIDPSDYQTQQAQATADLASARARLAQARAQIAVDQAKVDQQKAAVTAAEAVASRAAADRARYLAVQSNAVSRTQLDLAKTQASSTAAEVDVARSQEKAAEAQLEPDQAAIQAAEAGEQQAQARLKQAELNLSYTKVPAPRAGRITRRTVEAGNYVQAGQAILAIVPNDMWVVANFKETQLTHMRAGQPVTVRVDAYPQREWRAKVDSLQAGSGARFSLLPPENAVGNYVKVVQRVPVKIVFEEPLNDPGLDIAPGMSAEPKVRVQ